MSIRKAQPRDAAAVQTLYQTLVPGDRNINVVPQRIAELQDTNNHLFVAELDGSVCGSAFLTVCLDPMYGFAPYGTVENVIVLADRRGAGMGRALMIAVEQEARAARCTKLMLLSSTERVEAHRFFARLGFDGERKRGFIKYLNRATLP